MMRDLKCSYCKNDLAYVSKMQTMLELYLRDAFSDDTGG